tara:strand:+ start:1504 stop:2115 length:612 start_codon:yes stop_codon:yes gene_type:complete
MNGLLSIALDCVVLIGLGVTIFYCIKLSKALNNFRKYRQEFNTLVGELGKNIEHAQDAIANLKNSSFEAGEDLQKVVNNARKLTDELQLMHDMGNSLANRLERISDSSRQKMPEKSDFDLSEKRANFTEGKKQRGKPGASSVTRHEDNKRADAPSFFIQDRDFEQEEKYEDDEVMTRDLDDDGFDSQAERELYEALMKNTKKK